MCRMIAATGRPNGRRLLEAIRKMAANDNPVHRHEKSALGREFRHEDGWGAAWVADGEIRTVRRTQSILRDDQADQTLHELKTDLLLIHARRASRGDTQIQNTHPFTARYLDRNWAFCHNGTIGDPENPPSFERVPGLELSGATDSEAYFHHLLWCIGTYAARHRRPAHDSSTHQGPGHRNRREIVPPEIVLPEPLLQEIIRPAILDGLSVLHTYTAAHCFLATSRRIAAVAARHPERGLPDYHALWEGHGTAVHVVSSEPVSEVDCVWMRLAEPGMVLLEASCGHGG